MKKKIKISPFILSGGSGKRLWPLSKSLFPKQFIKINNQSSYFQDTLTRINDKKLYKKPNIICNIDNRFLIKDQAKEIGIELDKIILEPIRKNTSASAIISSIYSGEEELILLIPSDHAISDKKKFNESIRNGIDDAINGNIVLFGIKSISPETGYGYISIKNNANNKSYIINKFIEKPNLQNAKKLYKKSNIFWNSGIFLFKAGEYLSALEKFQPNVFKCVEGAMKNKAIDGNFILPDYNFMSECPSISIDYGVMEKILNGRVVKFNSGWSDIGSWESLSESKSKDSNNNSFEGDVIIHNSKNIHVHSEDHLVVVSNVEDIVIVNTRDALFVSKKS